MKQQYARRLVTQAFAASLAFAPLHASHAQGEPHMVTKTLPHEDNVTLFSRNVLDKLADFVYRSGSESWTKGAGLPADVFGELNRIRTEWVESGKLNKLPPEPQKIYDGYMKSLLEFASAGQRVSLITPVRTGEGAAQRVSNVAARPKLPPFQDTSGQIVTEPIEFTSGSLIGARLGKADKAKFDQLQSDFLNAYLTGKGKERTGDALADFIESKGLTSSLGVGPSQSREILRDLREGKLSTDTNNQLSAELSSKLIELVHSVRVRIPAAAMVVGVDANEIRLAQLSTGTLVLRAGVLLAAIAHEQASPTITGDLQNGHDIFLGIQGGDVSVQMQGRVGAGLKIIEQRTAYVDVVIERNPLKGNSPVQFSARIGFSDEKGLKIGPVVVYSETSVAFRGHIAGRASFGDTSAVVAGTSLSFPVAHIKGMPASLLVAVEGDPARDATSLSPRLRGKFGLAVEPENLVIKLYGSGAALGSGGRLSQGLVGAGASFGIVPGALFGVDGATFEGGAEWNRALYRLELFGQSAEKPVNSVLVFLRANL